jgi:hypothetical protein
MPLVQYVGNASAQDNTEVINLDPAEDGTSRSITRGSRGLVSGQELRNLVGNYQIQVIEMGTEQDLDVLPTEMPEGYNSDGYLPGESPTDVVFTNEAFPSDSTTFDATQATQAAADSPSAAAVPVAPAVPTPAAVTNPSPAVSAPAAAPGASDFSSSASSSPASPADASS